MNQKILTILSCFAVVLSSALSALLIMHPEHAKAYTSPGKPTGFVNDYAGIVDDSAQANIEADLQNFRSTTSNEIVVVTIRSLGGDSKENFANKLAREWGIGGAKYGNGVLVLIAVNERQIRIEVSQHLEGAITDLISSRIAADDMAPKFRAGDYNGGITAGIAKLKLAAQGEYNAAPAARSKNSFNSYGNMFFIVIFVLSWLSSFFARSKSVVAGGLVGGAAGIGSMFLVNGLLLKILVVVFGPAVGLLLDWVVSRNYKKNISRGGRGGFLGTWGGFSGGSRGGGGFGGFGGGGSFGGGGGGSNW